MRYDHKGKYQIIEKGDEFPLYLKRGYKLIHEDHYEEFKKALKELNEQFIRIMLWGK